MSEPTTEARPKLWRAVGEFRARLSRAEYPLDVFDAHFQDVLDIAKQQAAASALASLRERMAANLTAVVDHHWLAQGIETGTAYCTCGEWSFDARVGQAQLPVVGERFAPFSEHVAAAVLAEIDKAAPR